MDVLLRHNNQRHKLRVDADATLESFMRHVDALTNISPSRQLLKVGYPPQPLGGLQRSGDGGGRRKGASLRELGIQSNELIIVEEVPAAPEMTPAAEERGADGAASPTTVPRVRDGDSHRINGETAAVLLTKSCPPARAAYNSSSSRQLPTCHSTSEQRGCCRPLAPPAAAAGPSPPSAAAASLEEDAYTWEDDVAFEEDDDEEESSVGMPVGCGSGGVAAAAAGVLHKGDAAAASGASAAAGSHRVGGKGGHHTREELLVGSDGLHAMEDDYLPCAVVGAAAAETALSSSSSSSSWSEGGGARLLRVGGGLSNGNSNKNSNSSSNSSSSSSSSSNSSRKKKSFQEAADPSIVGEALRYVVPSDNSCLFTCLCLLAAPHATPQQLRALVGSVIDADPENFTDAVLERPRQEYIEWILSPTSWGGYVELAILAEQLQHEVVCVDVETKRKDFYGDARTGRRIYLLYDGVHYDAIVARRKRFSTTSHAERIAGGGGGSGSSLRRAATRAAVGIIGGGGAAAAGDDDLSAEGEEEEYLRVFSPTDREMEAKAAAVAAELHQMKQFTNLRKMAMQCLVCGAGIRDQEHAREHAREFGHANFGETRR